MSKNIIINIARIKRIPIFIKNIRYNELFRADGLFLVNSLIGIWPIRQLESKIYQAIDLTKEITTSLEEIRIIKRS